jgi:hypothetical protein
LTSGPTHPRPNHARALGNRALLLLERADRSAIVDSGPALSAAIADLEAALPVFDRLGLEDESARARKHLAEIADRRER